MEPAVESTLRKRLKERMDALGMNARETALRAGLGESFVRDILRGKTRSPTAANLAKLATALQTTIEHLHGRSIDESTVRPVSARVAGVAVIGRVAANTWFTADDLEQDGDDVESVPSVSGYPVEWQFGMIVEGNCLNKIANDGDRLVCLDLIKSQIDVSDGDLVIVERLRYGGQMRQRTAKRVRRTRDGYELWPESTDPAHQEPIKIGDAPDGDEIRIWAKVLWILRRP